MFAYRLPAAARLRSPLRSTLRATLLAAAGLTALAGGASAQTQPGDAVELDEVIVTASPFGVSQRASVIATDVVDEQALAVAPAQSLGDLLAGQPGLRSTGFAPGASRPLRMSVARSSTSCS